jgi:hypothetical protein
MQREDFGVMRKAHAQDVGERLIANEAGRHQRRQTIEVRQDNDDPEIPNTDGDPERIEAASTSVRAADAAAYIQRLVAEAPPLSDADKLYLTRLLTDPRT